MSSVIIDGTGGGFRAKVGSDNRLAVDAVTETIQEKSLSSGDSFAIATSKINLVTTNESALYYVKNNEIQDLVITALFINTTNSVGTLGSGQPEFKIYRNPTTGTLIDNAKAVSVVSNSNFGSNKTLVADIYEGVEGDTVATSSTVIEFPLPSRQIQPLNIFNDQVIIPRGSSAAISYKPEAGSTSVDVIIGMTLIKLPLEFA